MYYRSEIQSVVRIDPKNFKNKLKEAIFNQLKENYEGNIVESLGRIISILSINKISEGNIIPGDGGIYYRTEFTAINYKPEIQEIVEGEVKDIANFGIFIDLGPFEGLIHISQSMDEYVSINKQGVLQGKESKRVLKVGDRVRARIIAVSFKDPADPKIGLTMRQPALGKLEWIEEDREKAEKEAKKAAAKAKKK